MYKICLLTLVLHSSVYPMLRHVIKATMQSAVIAQRSCAVVPTQRSFADKAPEEQASVHEFVQLLREQKAKLDPTFLARLRRKKRSDDDEKDWHSCGKFRELALAELFGRDKTSVSPAVEMRDHETLAHLLARRANPNARRTYWRSQRVVDAAMENDDLPSLKLLMKAGAKVDRITNIKGMSVEMFGYLLGQGVRESDPWYRQSYIRDLIDSIMPGIDETDRRTVMLKVMLAVNSGATANPNMGYGNRLLESFCARDMQKNFAELIDYLFAAHTLASDVCATKKKAAEVKIRRIMKQYGIKKEEVTVVQKAVEESSRVQEAD